MRGIRNVRQIMEMAAPHWEKLSSDEKEVYKTKSKFTDANMTFNNTELPSKRKRYNCFGEDIDVMQLNLDIEHETYGKMVAEIKSQVCDASELGELHTKIFWFISTTSFFDCVDGVYAAELALAKFSLKEGIIDDIQIRINPGELPLGSSSSAQEKSKKFHRYPLPPRCDGESDYMTILETMIKFVHPLDKLPIFFTEGNTRDNKIPLQETWKIVDKIFYESQEDDMMKDLKIYPIDELFYIMQKTTAIVKNRSSGTFEPAFPSISYAADRFQADDFRYTTNGCTFHNDEDVSQYCCLSKVRRYGYTIAKWCADNKLYQLKPGRHFPETYDCQL